MIYQDYLKYCENHNYKDEFYSLLIKELNSYIISLIHKFQLDYEKDDLYQELTIRIFNIVERKSFRSTFLTKFVDNEASIINIIENDYNKKLAEYLSKSMENEKLYSIKNNSFKELMSFCKSFCDFIVNIEFKSYIQKSLFNCCLDIIKKTKNKKCILLDTNFVDCLDSIYDNKKNANNYQELLKEKLNKKEIIFLNHFIANNGEYLLTQKEVADKLNVSHQYVSRRFNHIKKTINK